MEERKSAVRKQFDRDAVEYLSKHLTPEKLRERDRVLSLATGRKKYERVLDLGCGPGTISNDLLEISDEVWGIDLSEDMIRIATDRFRNTEYEHRIHFVAGDAEKLDFPDKYFDAVISLGVLRYLDSLEKGLKEINRVLKPGGVLIGTFYHRYSLYCLSMLFLYRPLLPLISIFKKRSFRGMIMKYKAEPSPFSYRKFRKIFAATGFRHSDTLHSGLNVFPFNTLFPNLSRKIYLKTESVFHDSGKLGWMGSVCIVKGQKSEQ
jgi:demethylmenaquinone methyltransferase / 2-methoxy-6-polyprenyl-1,4-benzoquinol methylase